MFHPADRLGAEHLRPLRQPGKLSRRAGLGSPQAPTESEPAGLPLRIGGAVRQAAIFRAAAEDAVAWAGGNGRVAPVDWVRNSDQLTDLRERFEGIPALLFVRLALTEEQADDLNLLDADGKAEVDAVPVPIMDRWLTDAIEALHDPACRESLRGKQELERERLADAIRDALNYAS